MKLVVKVKLDSKENILKQIRQALGISQEEFAKRLGVNRSSVARWETGYTKEASFTLRQIKALEKEIGKIGLGFADLPDDLN
jgi:transcriptional regulator with XRE-family HTH domain